MLDEQTGELTSGGTPEYRSADKFRNAYGVFKGGATEDGIGASRGGASRFYYVAKPSREERDYGCHDLTPRPENHNLSSNACGVCGLRVEANGSGRKCECGERRETVQRQRGGNIHPTVKPVELMRWLVKLVTPPGGTVLDPFCGSGTTGMACRYELRAFIGIEREAEYIEIAERRIAAVAPLFGEATA